MFENKREIKVAAAATTGDAMAHSCIRRHLIAPLTAAAGHEMYNREKERVRIEEQGAVSGWRLDLFFYLSIIFQLKALNIVTLAGMNF